MLGPRADLVLCPVFPNISNIFAAKISIYRYTYMHDIVKLYYRSSLYPVHPKTAHETTLQPITYLLTRPSRLILVHSPPLVKKLVRQSARAASPTDAPARRNPSACLGKTLAMPPGNIKITRVRCRPKTHSVVADLPLLWLEHSASRHV